MRGQLSNKRRGECVRNVSRYLYHRRRFCADGVALLLLAGSADRFAVCVRVIALYVVVREGVSVRNKVLWVLNSSSGCWVG